MKAPNFIKRIGSFFNKKALQVKEVVVEQAKQVNETREAIMARPNVIQWCSGAPIPQRLPNQRQRRKARRQLSTILLILSLTSVFTACSRNGYGCHGTGKYITRVK